MHSEETVRLSRRGQITLPKHIREILGSDLVRITAEGSAVRIEPVRDLAGCLSRYARSDIAPEDAREKAWAEAVHEKHPRR